MRRSALREAVVPAPSCGLACPSNLTLRCDREPGHASPLHRADNALIYGPTFWLTVPDNGLRRRASDADEGVRHRIRDRSVL